MNAQFFLRPYSTKILVAAITTSISVAFFFLWASVAFAASLQLTPASGTYPSGQNFSVQVAINAAGAAVNSAEGTISFDASKLTVVNVSNDGAFNLWVEEPSFSNSAGTISFSGGGTTPFSNTRTIMTVTFRGKAEGSAAVSFQSGKVLAGAGQDVSGTNAGGTYTIGPAAAPQQPEQPQQPTQTTTPGAGIKPQPPRNIESSTHPEEDVWYSATSSNFSWDVPYGILAVRTSFAQSTTTDEVEEHEPPVADMSYEVPEDGVWHFTLAFKNRNGWGDAASYQIQVDSMPPEPFEVSAEGGDLSAVLTFQTTDALSGIDNYIIYVDDLEVDAATPGDLGEEGNFTLTGINPGDHAITVVAFDNAGNSISADTDVTVTGELPGEEVEEDETSLFGPVFWVSMIFVVIVTVLAMVIWYMRRKFDDEKDQIKREAVEASERLVGIFDVLREEIEEKILMLSHKPNMTDNERQILTGLKDALDISEELLDKEIEDVRKLVK